MSTRTAQHDQATTFEEVAELDPDSQAGELDAGRWVPMTRNTQRHGVILANATALLREFKRRNPGWSVSAGDAGCKLAHAPDVLRGPDVAVFRRDRFPTGKGVAGWLEGAPEVAIEVAGDAQSMAEMLKKALEYLRAGALAVWIVDPEPRSVVVILPGQEPRVIGPDGTLDGGDALPGFACQISELFEE